MARRTLRVKDDLYHEKNVVFRHIKVYNLLSAVCDCLGSYTFVGMLLHSECNDVHTLVKCPGSATCCQIDCKENENAISNSWLDSLSINTIIICIMHKT